MNHLTYFYLLFFLASLSYTASQVSIFLINKVTGWRLLFGIFYSILVFVLQLTLWALSTNTIAYVFFKTDFPPYSYITLFQPVLIIFLWSVFTFLPFIGRGIAAIILLLALWTVVTGITTITHLTFFQSFVCAFGGWVLLTLLQVLFEKALIRKSNAFWTLATGRKDKLTSTDIKIQLDKLTDEVTEFMGKN